jgi:hypothetical protein
MWLTDQRLFVFFELEIALLQQLEIVLEVVFDLVKLELFFAQLL